MVALHEIVHYSTSQVLQKFVCHVTNTSYIIHSFWSDGAESQASVGATWYERAPIATSKVASAKDGSIEKFVVATKRTAMVRVIQQDWILIQKYKRSLSSIF